MNTFKTYHPIVNFAYFTFVIVFSMFFMHPVCLGISLFCSFAYSILLNGKKAARFNFLYMLPMLLFAALVNPAFNHEGASILGYLPGGNPLTFESIAYGVSAAVMIVSVICWFSCYNAVMTSDKFIYLFGRVAPSLSLVLSMTLRFVPKFKEQMRVVANAQKCIGRDVTGTSMLQRAKNGVSILSIMVTWALENAVETADSMKSRGYGLKGRTSFSIYTFDLRDKRAMIAISLLGIYVAVGKFAGGLYFRYFPTIKSVAITPYSISLFFAYFALCMLPIIIEIREAQNWKSIKSKI